MSDPNALEGQVNGVCATLPSSTAAYRLLAGEESALGEVIVSTAGRMALVGLGAWLAGVRGEQLTRAAIGGGLGIEVFVIGYAAWNLRRAR